jgi:hypothetical protein
MPLFKCDLTLNGLPVFKIFSCFACKPMFQVKNMAEMGNASPNGDQYLRFEENSKFCLAFNM